MTYSIHESWLAFCLSVTPVCVPTRIKGETCKSIKPLQGGSHHSLLTVGGVNHLKAKAVKIKAFSHQHNHRTPVTSSPMVTTFDNFLPFFHPLIGFGGTFFPNSASWSRAAVQRDILPPSSASAGAFFPFKVQRTLKSAAEFLPQLAQQAV